MEKIVLRCVDCDSRFQATESVRYRCGCGGTLDVQQSLNGKVDYTKLFEERLTSRNPNDRSGVWKYRELILPDFPAQNIITRLEGNTNLYMSNHVSSHVGIENLHLKHEGENPTGSFKDRGMTVAISMAKQLGFNRVACASTGNTSASMASYAASAGMRSYVFVPDGKISSAKLSQALASGALTLQLSGNFDDAMRAIEQICTEENIYLVNSINPFRIEGQKAIAFEMMQDLEWKAPDWVVVPGGNLGNNSAIIKGLLQLRELNLIDKLPKVAVIQASGANPLAIAWRNRAPMKPVADPKTVASAICIGNPVSWSRSIRGIQEVGGCVDDVYDAEILDAKAVVDASGIGAEPASCATVAGLKKLVEKNVIKKEETVCCVLTGHALKDTETTSRYHEGEFLHTASQYRNPPVKVECSMAAIREVLKNHD